MKAIIIISITLGSLKLQSQNLTNGLQACYPMNCSAINMAVTGTPLNGTAVNLTCTTGHLGQPGTAYSFPGLSSSYFVVPGTPLTKSTNSLCILGWYFSSPTSLNVYDQYLVYSKNNCSINWEAFALYAQFSPGGVKFCLEKHASPMCGGFDIIPASATAINSWHHVVFYIDNTSAELYIDGVLAGSITHTVPFDYLGGKDIVLGGSNESPYFFPFMGKIDNVRFYNRKLTAQEVNILYTVDPDCSASPLAPVSSFTVAKAYCKAQQVIFSGSASNNPTQWNWQFQGGIPATSSINNPTVTFPNSGTYTVSLTASNASVIGTAFTQTILVNNCTVIDEKEASEVGLFFISDASGELIIKATDESELVFVKVSDLNGKVLHVQCISANEAPLWLERLQSAVYIIEAQTSTNKILRKKFVKL